MDVIEQLVEAGHDLYSSRKIFETVYRDAERADAEHRAWAHREAPVPDEVHDFCMDQLIELGVYRPVEDELETPQLALAL